MGKVKQVDENTFSEEIRTNTPVMVDFWAEWCTPCRMIAPVMEEIATKYEGKLKVIKVNVDDNQDLAEKYQVRNLPTLVVLKNGKPIDQVSGGVSKSAIQDMLSSLI